MEKCLVNDSGEFLDMVIDETVIRENLYVVPFSNMYDVLNVQRYDEAIWDFTLKKWVGKGEQRPYIHPQPSLDERLKSLESGFIALVEVFESKGIITENERALILSVQETNT